MDCLLEKHKERQSIWLSTWKTTRKDNLADCLSVKPQGKTIQGFVLLKSTRKDNLINCLVDLSKVKQSKWLSYRTFPPLPHGKTIFWIVLLPVAIVLPCSLQDNLCDCLVDWSAARQSPRLSYRTSRLSYRPLDCLAHGFDCLSSCR